MFRHDHQIYLSSDSKFQDAVVGENVGPLTNNGFNIGLFREADSPANALYDIVRLHVFYQNDRPPWMDGSCKIYVHFQYAVRPHQTGARAC